jgi:hypothetical protein
MEKSNTRMGNIVGHTGWKRWENVYTWPANQPPQRRWRHYEAQYYSQARRTENIGTVLQSVLQIECVRFRLEK